MTDEELKSAWNKFSEDMKIIVQDGSPHSAFLFIRIDQQPDGGISTHQLSYNVPYVKYIGLSAFVLKELEKHAPPNYKYMAGKVLKLFNKCFGTFNRERVIN